MLLFAFHQAKSDWSDWFCAEILSKYNGLLSLTFIQPGIEIETLEEKKSFRVIFLTRNMPEDWDIIYLEGEIHSFVWSIKIIL